MYKRSYFLSLKQLFFEVLNEEVLWPLAFTNMSVRYIQLNFPVPSSKTLLLFFFPTLPLLVPTKIPFSRIPSQKSFLFCWLHCFWLQVLTALANAVTGTIQVHTFLKQKLKDIIIYKLSCPKFHYHLSEYGLDSPLLTMNTWIRGLH